MKNNDCLFQINSLDESDDWLTLSDNWLTDSDYWLTQSDYWLRNTVVSRTYIQFSLLKKGT